MISRLLILITILLINQVNATNKWTSLLKEGFETYRKMSTGAGARPTMLKGSISEKVISVKKKLDPLLGEIHLPMNSVLKKYSSDPLESISKLIEDTDYDEILTETSLKKDGYGIMPEVAEYWRYRSVLLKFAILLGNQEAENIYKDHLVWFSSNMQWPEVSNNEGEEAKALRTFYWTLLAFEDPVSRQYLSLQYQQGICVPNNPILSQFWQEKYVETLSLPLSIRSRILSTTPRYPFRELNEIPNTESEWSKFFPTQSYFKE